MSTLRFLLALSLAAPLRAQTFKVEPLREAPLAAPVQAPSALALPLQAAAPLSPGLSLAAPSPLARPVAAAPRALPQAARLASSIRASAVPAAAPWSRLQALPALLHGPVLSASDGVFDGVASHEELSGRRPGPDVPEPPDSIPAAPTFEYQGIAAIRLPTYLFSHKTVIEDELVRAIDNVPAGEALRLALHGIDLEKATDAILRAHARGVDVRILLNHGHVYPERRSHHRSPQIQRLIDANVTIRTLRGTGPYGVMHQKQLMIGRKVLKLGSFNWSNAANRNNFENAMFRNDAELIDAAIADYEWMWAQAAPLDGQATPASSGPPRDEKLNLRFKGQPWPKIAFSPNGGVEGWILRAISLLQPGDTLDIADFGFYSQNVGDALVEAKNRGVIIRIMMDRSQANQSPLPRFFVERGFDFRIVSGRRGRGVMHHKFVVFNRELLKGGSYNLSENARDHNFENAVFSTDASDLAGYQAEFEYVWAQAEAPTLDQLRQVAPAGPHLMGHEGQ